MWLLTDFGFFSVVQKAGDGDLTVRSRVRADLDLLRERYLPTLSPTVKGGGTDYPYRASASHIAMAEAAAKIVKDIHYPNFKNSVAKTQGHARHDLYSEVWVALRKLKDEPKQKATPMPALMGSPTGKGMAYGGVVVDGKGNVLLRKPSGGFGGMKWTFAKGRPENQQTQEEVALREVLEETGWECEIICKISGSYEGDVTTTEYFLMKPIHDTGHFDQKETEAITWVTTQEAKELIGETPNPTGRKRDLAVLAAALKAAGE
jgi:8-oxo-dGTP pyrophosphatase MutT (NUDIX family)